MEKIRSDKVGLEAIYAKLAELRPIPEDVFVPTPSSKQEQKEAFLSGKIRNPHFTYELIDANKIAGTEVQLVNLKARLLEMDVDEANLVAYCDTIENFRDNNHFIWLSHRIQTEKDEAKKEEFCKEWRYLNRELFGEPDPDTFGQLLQESVKKAAKKAINEQAITIYEELLELLTADWDKDIEAQKYKPSEEAVELAKRTVEALFGGLLSHVPDQEEAFKPEEVQKIFAEILSEEFGDAADGWEVVLSDATAINVQASQKLIKIPKDRQPISTQELKGLVAHEIGVHFLRSVMAGNLSVAPLQLGLSKYLTIEEGLAKVFEQGAKGKYIPASPDYYLVCGLAHLEGQDFRGCYEILWRLSALKKIKIESEPEEIQNAVKDAKDLAYRNVFRIFRGTDELPWSKDLAYYNGVRQAWQYIENFGMDYTTLSLILMGKADPQNETHRRVLLESKTVVKA
jgi:hypothetical protein